MTKVHVLLASLAIVAVTMVAGCSDRRQSSVTVGSGFNDAAGFTRADSIVSVVGDTRDHRRTLEVVDSLERRGELSLVKTIFYRTITYNLMGRQRTSLRLYARLADIDVRELNNQIELESYVYSYNNYVRVLCEMRRYDRALREANAADRKLRTIGYDTFTSHHDIAQIIGECQLYLGQTTLAASSFQKSLEGVHTRLATFHDPLDYRECQKTMNAIAKAYYHTGYYDNVQPWIAVEDSLYAVADKLPERDTVFLDEMWADINFSKAMLAQAQGRTDDARRAFDAYLQTREAHLPGNVMNSTTYLLLAHRYDEAACIFEQLDAYIHESGYETDLETMGRYMIPKFRANVLAGRHDSAFHVAMQIAADYDSALVRQRMVDADLLTTFYDTEGKERQIAEQRAELSQQRLFTGAIITLIFVVFVIFYTIQRRRAYKKLDATNHQLMLANERAEESARMKTKFIQQISHEVRTPLNVLSGFTQVLATPDMHISSGELQIINRKIVENSERITQLIDKMLDLSLVNDHAEIELSDTVSPQDIVEQAVDKSGIRQAVHLELLIDQQPQTAELRLVTNTRLAVKALQLLLDNAMKFTHPLAFSGGSRHYNGLQRVCLSVTTDGRVVTFTVEDTGIGIPKDQAENIFSEFVQLDEYSDGTGIGLPIARSLVRQMGGDITLDTTYTDGARFVMTLPVNNNQ